jgi:signal transduction histidine kinase
MTQVSTSNETATSPARPRLSSAGEVIFWPVLGIVLFGVVAGVAYRPSGGSLAELALAVLPWVMLSGMSAAFLAEPVGLSPPTKALAVVAALAGWAVLIFENNDWTLLAIAIYAVCFVAYTDGPLVGIVLASAVTVVWAAAYLVDDAPNWLAILPLAAFAFGTAISLSMHRAGTVNEAQADLIDQLHATRRELAFAEHSKGVLEERARLAGEIHDTLAQGFTSIVLLSRAAQRSGSSADALATIEETAQENLDAARRLIEAIGPAELESASLRDALDRHVSTALPSEVMTEFRVVGEPTRLTGDVEVMLLRVAQEALLNVRAHADARRVEVTLSYFDDAVALDIRDDGVGFQPGQISDRGALTGGQGLNALHLRTQSLAGQLTIEPNEGGGSVLSVLLPAGDP